VPPPPFVLPPESRADRLRGLLAGAGRQRAAIALLVLLALAGAATLRLRAEPAPAPTAAADPGLVEEVRQLVVARNERRARAGEPPLDVEAEVERQLRDLGAM
jgi:hypothetical protein